jgi:hypothetical protein
MSAVSADSLLVLARQVHIVLAGSQLTDADHEFQIEQVNNGVSFDIDEAREVDAKEIEFYGEPAPKEGEDEEDSDREREISKGISMRRKRNSASVIENESIPGHEIIQLDFCTS